MYLLVMHLLYFAEFYIFIVEGAKDPKVVA